MKMVNYHFKIKKLGIRYYETRYTSFWDSNVEKVDDLEISKLNSIGDFKRGFASNSFPCLRWLIDLKKYK